MSRLKEIEAREARVDEPEDAQKVHEADSAHTAEPSERRPRRWWLYGLALAIIAAVVIVVVMLTRGDSSAPAAEPAPALTVTAASAHRVVWPQTFAAQGAIAAWQEASIGAQIGGYALIDVRVNVGDHVRKGEVLARFDPMLLQAEEARLRASYAEANANRARALGLQSSGAISQQDVLNYVTKAETAAAELAANRLQLRYTSVLAPDDGVISARTATLGAVAGVGQELFKLIRKGRLEWRGQFTAEQLARIRPGQRIALDLPDGSQAFARVRETAPSLDTQSRLGTVFADVEPGSAARAGMYADGRVQLGQSPALVVPAISVIIRDGRNYVLKLADRSATPRVTLSPVTTGRRNGVDVEIVRGIADGERVVAEGADFLNDGDVVRLGRASGQATPIAPTGRTP